MRRFGFIILHFLFFLGLTSHVEAQTLTPSTVDLFDVSQGTQIISHTAVHSTSNIRNIFGHEHNPNYPSEVANTLFDDRKPMDTIHAVEWVTATPIHLDKIALHARHDANTNRSIKEFRLYAQQANGALTLVDTLAITPPYSSNNELHYSKDLDLVSQRFKAEFIQHVPSSLSSGPRIIELDGFGTALPASEGPVTDDLFDLSSGTTITNHGPTLNVNGQSDIRDMFGGNFTNIAPFPEETGNTIFTDNQSAGTIHYVEWRTASPVTLEKFRLHAYHDPHAPNNPNEIRDANQRGFRRFSLFAKDQSGVWQQIYEYLPVNPYGQGQAPYFNELTIERIVNAPTAQEFRAEFEQFGPANALHSGPRVVELDGFGEVVTTSTPPAILFIPGLKASRLYAATATGENRLWEPNRNADVEKLFLTESGHSINPNIYTSDVIDEAFGQNIYKTFLEFLDDLKSQGTITDWRTIPYDWRLANNGHADNVIATLRDLASTNQNIAIITHSNGALVAKAALKVLVDQNDPLLDSVNQIIYVAAPHQGTPGAIAAALHGYDQQLVGGLILSGSTARELAEDMASTFELFPSAQYFNAVIDPVITFDESVQQLSVFNSLNSITSLTSLRQFITGEGSARVEPQPDDIGTPNILSGTLFDAASTAHASYNELQLPSHIEITNIIGWGLDTIKAIHYQAVPTQVCHHLDKKFCKNGYELDLRPEITIEGDETIVYTSAEAGTDKFYLDLSGFNNENLLNRYHRNILETEPIKHLLGNLIIGREEPIKYIATKKPQPSFENERLRVSIHSPVSLSLADDLGKNTGISTNHGTDLKFIDAKIPNSYYFELGEGKYAGASLENSLTIKLQGKDTGTFDLEIQEVHGEDVVEEAIFSDIPVTVDTVAAVEVPSPGAEKVLTLDIDGNGAIDAAIKSAESPSINLLLSAFRSGLDQSQVRHGIKKSIQVRLDVIERFIKQSRHNSASFAVLKSIDRELERIDRRNHETALQGLRDILSLILKHVESHES